MRRLPLALTTALAAAVILAGCTTATPPSATPSATPPLSAAPTPEVVANLVVALDGISFTDASGTVTASFDDGTALLALLQQATGELPEPEPIDAPDGYGFTLVNYDWDGLRVTADESGDGPASIAVLAAEVDGIPVATTEGLAVGATRSELVDAGAWALVDEEDTATAEYLGLDGREVPDTISLTHPGSVGIEYLLFALDGDVVTQIQVPANDFSDI
ncbi:hypothetical protein KZC51_08750 [Microbacterium sp. SSW1-49]|uniref:Uncharacterized protein n=1 Tax=Microbacterium croceum TaxID=2851645 RepID=A0ABT0FDU6_9MICO|nr:hypothetical protein [Microbacterium croceum]MCK2036225.1 hypothetical protein [Microbacterium croceum]